MKIKYIHIFFALIFFCNCSISYAENIVFTINGQVTGLLTNQSLIVDDSNAGSVTITDNGLFTLPNTLSSGESYNLSITSMPINASCTIANGSGIVNKSNVNNIVITCAPISILPNFYNMNFSISGFVTGLPANTPITIFDNNAGSTNITTISGTNAFMLPNVLTNGESFNVSISSIPGEFCNLSNQSGTINNKNVVVNITCSTTNHTISGRVIGLLMNESVMVSDDNGGNVTITNNGLFTLPNTLSDGESYNLSISSMPINALCTIANGSGIINGGNVNNIVVNCSNSDYLLYSLNGSVTGLNVGSSITLHDDLAGDVIINAADTDPIMFLLPKLLANNSAYSVSITEMPQDQTCNISNNSGMVSGQNVININVICNDSMAH
jgi:hypothetical protein